MTTPQKRFCVLTTGRAGSTALMNCLERFDDVALPSKDIDCVDNELLHHRDTPKHAREYARLCKTRIETEDDLIRCFFDHNAESPFAGFKSMPKRHKNYGDFIQRPDIRFIVLTRDDIASTAASFLTAMAAGSWRRSGEAQEARFEFTKDHAKTVLSNLAYIHESLVLLDRVPEAIRLTYEDLCDPGFACPALDAFFGRPVRIEDPKPPTSGRDYVANWDEFEDFVVNTYGEMLAQGRQTGRRAGPQTGRGAGRRPDRPPDAGAA